MNISTKRGDQGLTDVKDRRVRKDDPIIETLGLIDETIAFILLPDSFDYRDEIIGNLSAIAADIAGYKGQFDTHLIELLEEKIKDFPADFSFIYPKNNLNKANLNVCRVKVRQLERQLFSINYDCADQLSFINRLSDYFFILIQ